MLGLMQDREMMVTSVLEYAATYFGDVEVVSRNIEGSIHRSNYRRTDARARRLAQALARLGIRPGERVGGVSWNHSRYLEAFFGVSGMGAILHTVNPRLFPEQLVYMINHAEDRFLLVDLGCVDIVAGIIEKLETVEGIVVFTDAAHMPEGTLPDALCYEDLLAAEDGDYVWPSFDERSASVICYTSGTTGHPKGVVYSHRSSVIQALAVAGRNATAMSYRDTAFPVVPIYHGNGWSVPYLAPMTGAKLVLPGREMDMKSLHELIVGEGVTMAMAVPTIWLAMLQYLKETDQDLGRLERILTGGTAPPRALMEALARDYGVATTHGWGMTETSAGTTMSMPDPGLEGDAALDARLNQGKPVYGAEMRLTGDDGQPLAWDGRSAGELLVRGYWVSSAYYRRDDVAALDGEGWLRTGDMAVIDEGGSMRLTDRLKDVIKSGGEWISSIDLENAAVGHPDVAEAAVIAIPHPKWQERPMLVAVPTPDAQVTAEDLRDWLAGRVAKWWLPDEVRFADELPHTGTGKVDKVALRQRFAAETGA